MRINSFIPNFTGKFTFKTDSTPGSLNEVQQENVITILGGAFERQIPFRAYEVECHKLISFTCAQKHDGMYADLFLRAMTGQEIRLNSDARLEPALTELKKLGVEFEETAD